uniref:ESCRT-II complex subunit VPS25 n=1 Tax=Pyramimonas obovata TaxID=1411642 RepID=A0A7S0NBG2_9CHLO|mmetsp:Transcript_23347/g.51060  ORF Transcript_23347/g.51060 Transcript_23347/m.51060 type:complete len:179 (+) Transcript_23347:362-898(+)
MSEEFVFPVFYNYPPYFTLQPVTDTLAKQKQLWKDLILQYCKHFKIYLVNKDDDTPLFNNQSIQRKLNTEAKEVFLGELVADGSGTWSDASHRQCLILWHKLEDWADILHSWARDMGLMDDVLTVEELRTGDDTRGTEIHGAPIELLLQAISHLEKQGKARLFQGDASEEHGVKFLTG